MCHKMIMKVVGLREHMRNRPIACHIQTLSSRSPCIPPHGTTDCDLIYAYVLSDARPLLIEVRACIFDVMADM